MHLNILRRKIYNLFHPEIGRILMLHRVTEERSRLAANRELEVTPAFLEKTILDYKQRGYRFVSMDEVFQILSSKKRTNFRKHPFVAITLDDGYRDNYEVAYPVFKKYQVPFCVNITTDFLERKALLWWYALDDVGVSDAEFEKYRDRIFSLPQQEIPSAFKQWFPCWKGSFEEIADRMSLTKEQVVMLSDEELCTIGVHTQSHARLDALSKEEQEHEILSSQHILSQLTHHEMRHFAFPYGFYNPDTLDILKQNNFHTAVRTWGGVIRTPHHLLELPRVELREL